MQPQIHERKWTNLTTGVCRILNRFQARDQCHKGDWANPNGFNTSKHRSTLNHREALANQTEILYCIMKDASPNGGLTYL